MQGHRENSKNVLALPSAKSRDLSIPPGLALHTPVGPELAQQTCPKKLKQGLLLCCRNFIISTERYKNYGFVEEIQPNNEVDEWSAAARTPYRKGWAGFQRSRRSSQSATDRRARVAIRCAIWSASPKLCNSWSYRYLGSGDARSRRSAIGCVCDVCALQRANAVLECKATESMKRRLPFFACTAHCCLLSPTHGPAVQQCPTRTVLLVSTVPS
jgi:hypothetical protein